MKEVEYEKQYKLGDTYFWFAGRAAIVKKFIDNLICSKENRILDVGCGTGNMTKFLKMHGIVYAIDSSKTALNFCQKQNLNLICQGSAMKLPFKSGQFDLLTSLDVLSHLSITDEYELLGEFHRVLKPNGYILIMDVACNFLKSGHDEVYETRERYYKKKLKRLLRENFIIIKMSYLNFFLFPLVLSIRIIRRVLNNFTVNPKSDLNPIHPWINNFFINIFRAEAALLQKISFPIGSSIICIAKKC